MSKLTGSQIRQKYLQYFKKQGHTEVPSAPLVPQNDSTTLFTSSGMQPMINYLLGEKHPQGNKIVDSQRCFRAEDIEEVGDNRHTTAFEMLGNWSLGDYFKKEQLNWFYQFLTKELGVPPSKLFVSVFSGNSAIPRDDEAIEIWQQIFKKEGIGAEVVDLSTDADKVGMQKGRIFLYGEKKNWWSRSGVPSKMPAGEPGGPDSEVFFEFESIEHDTQFGMHCHPNCDCGRYLEIGNSVFMQYQKQADGSFTELPQKNIDFGGGLERILAAVNNNSDVFLTDFFNPLIEQIESISGTKYHTNTGSFQILADHLKAAVWLASDGVVPSNKAQGYMMRRLIRRALSAGKNIGLETDFTAQIIPLIQQMYVDTYPQVASPDIIQIITDEELKFRKTLNSALKDAKKIINNIVSSNPENQTIADSAFDLYQSNGLPSDIFLDQFSQISPLSLERRQDIQQKFSLKFKAHQELSRIASAGMFKGGLADSSEKVTQYHTATHLLHQALREVLGKHVYQKGSNITAERLRFDFSHSERLTEQQIQQIEQLVNQAIQKNYPVYYQIMPLEWARESGAIGLFGEKYPEIVKVYSIGPIPENGSVNTEISQKSDMVSRNLLYSREFCGGPHVRQTLDIQGKFKIIKDEKVAKDIVRIKAELV